MHICRADNNWETNYSAMTKSNENSSQSSKKQRECGESARDSIAYSCLLKNELLGSDFEDIKNVSDDKMGYLSASNRTLFKYQSTRQVSEQLVPYVIELQKLSYSVTRVTSIKSFSTEEPLRMSRRKSLFQLLFFSFICDSYCSSRTLPLKSFFNSLLMTHF